MDEGRGLETMGPNISRSLFWLVLVLPLLADAAAGASVTERRKNLFYRWNLKKNTSGNNSSHYPLTIS